MPLLMVLDGMSSSALAGEVSLGLTGRNGALPCASAAVAVPARRIKANVAFFILFLLGSEKVIGVSPTLGLPWLERNGDVRLQAVGRADGPHVDLRDGRIGADALAEAGLAVSDREVVVAGLPAKAGHHALGSHTFGYRRQIANCRTVQLYQFRLQRLFGAPGERRGDHQMLTAGAQAEKIVAKDSGDDGFAAGVG